MVKLPLYSGQLSDYFFELFDRQSIMQKQFLKALAHSGENIFSADYIKRFRLTTVSTTQKAVSVLLESSIIDKTENVYFISDPFFKRFIQNYASKRNAFKRNLGLYDESYG